MDEVRIVWTDYMKYRGSLRGFELAMLEHIVRYSNERYIDTATGRLIAVGQHGEHLIMIPYERTWEVVTPVTAHVTSRQQVNSRLRSGRFTYE